MFAAVCAFAVISTANLYIPRVQPGSISEIKHYALIPDFLDAAAVAQRHKRYYLA